MNTQPRHCKDRGIGSLSRHFRTHGITGAVWGPIRRLQISALIKAIAAEFAWYSDAVLDYIPYRRFSRPQIKIVKAVWPRNAVDRESAHTAANDCYS